MEDKKTFIYCQVLNKENKQLLINTKPPGEKGGFCVPGIIYSGEEFKDTLKLYFREVLGVFITNSEIIGKFDFDDEFKLLLVKVIVDGTVKAEGDSFKNFGYVSYNYLAIDELAFINFDENHDSIIENSIEIFKNFLKKEI